MTTKTRIKQLEKRRQPGRPALVIAGDLVWDVVSNRPYTGNRQGATVICHVADRATWERL